MVASSKLSTDPAWETLAWTARKLSILLSMLWSMLSPSTHGGYHAFILVAKYGGKFTAEDLDVIDFLKKIFGNSFVKDFCILVFTCGDLFTNEFRLEDFKDWCKKQDGVFKQLVIECCNRVMLFDNRTKDTMKQNKQLNDLITMVDDLRWREKRYTNDHFRKAREEQEKSIVEASVPIIQEETMVETGLILGEIEKIQDEVDFKKIKRGLKELSYRAKRLHESILEQDNKTGHLKNILKTVEGIQRVISNEMKIAKKVKKEWESLKKKEEEKERSFEEETKRLNEKYERLIKQNETDDTQRQNLQKEQEKKLQEFEEKMKIKQKERKKKLNRKNWIKREKNNNK